VTSSRTGDADLYVLFGSKPISSSHDCRLYKNGNNETYTLTNPQAGTWHIALKAYATFSGVTVTASYE
jgi:serine protease